MKNTFQRLIFCCLFIVAFCTGAFAQYSYENEQPEPTTDIMADDTDPALDIQIEDTEPGNSSGNGIWNRGSGNEITVAATTSTPVTRSAIKLKTTDAPPDCPECTPDPGGNVNDVPFDRRMLVFLLAGGIYIFLKSEKRKNRFREKFDPALRTKNSMFPKSIAAKLTPITFFKSK